MPNKTAPHRKTKWGIIAPGKIAHSFAGDVLLSTDSELIAVASRNKQRADEFAQQYAIKDVYYDYDDLVNNSDCDVVYIASPHVFHKEQALSCIRAGKAVLCEKPVTLSASEFHEITEAAREHNVFFMEAMWTRFFPVMQRVLNAVAAGKIGQVNLIQANFGFKAEVDNEHRLYNPDLGGGSLLDTGVYVISLAQLFFKHLPDEIATQCLMTPTGVDGTGSYVLRYGHNQLALLSSSILTQTVNNATLYGDAGYLVMDDFWKPSKATLFYPDGSSEVIQEETTGKGYYYEIKHVESCLASGMTESPERCFKDTADVLEIMDAIRKQWRLVYPSEK